MFLVYSVNLWCFRGKVSLSRSEKKKPLENKKNDKERKKDAGKIKEKGIEIERVGRK